MSESATRRAWFSFAFIALLGLALALGQALPVQAASGQPAPLANPGPDCQPVSFTDDPDPIGRTGAMHFTVTFQNNAGDPVAGTDLFYIDLDPAFSYVSHTLSGDVPAGSSCSYDNTNSWLECAFPGLAPGEAVDVDLVALAANTTGLFPSEARVQCTGDLNPANDTESNQTTVIPGVDLVVSKAAGSGSFPAGSIITFDFTVTNTGPDDSTTGIVLQDTLPAGLSFVGDDASPPADDDAAWSCSEAGGTVTCTFGGTLGVGNSSTFHFRVRVDVPGPTTLVNEATAEVGDPSSEGEIDESDNTGSVTLTITEGTDVSIEKQVLTALPLVAGQPADFQLTVTNQGPMDTSDITVTDTFPAGYVINPGDITAPAGWTCNVTDSGGSNPTVTCNSNGTTLASGDSVVITITATPPIVSSPESHTNSASVTLNDITDAVTSNNSDSVTYNVYPNQPDLGVVKSVSPVPVAQGYPLTITLSVTNHGAVDANPVEIRDALDPGETVDLATLPSGSPWDCTYDAGTHEVVCTYTDNGGTLAAGASATVSYQVTATNAGTLTDTACATVNQSGYPDDYDNTNDCDSASTVSTTEHADLVVSKTVDDTHLDTTEDTLTFTVSITNGGPDTATSVSFNDEVPFYVPAGTGGRPATTITVTNVTGGGTCSVTGGTVSCSWASIPDGTTVTVEYTVQRPMADGASIINDVCAYSSEVGDPNRSNNCDSAPAVQVDPVTDVEVVSKSASFTDDGSGNAVAGTDVTYTIVVRNNGPSDASNVQITDDFSSSSGTFTFISATATAGGTCSYTAPTVTCNWATLAANTSATITVVVRPDHSNSPPSPWNLVNEVTGTTTTTDSNPGNDGPISFTLGLSNAQLNVVLEKNESPDFTEPVWYDPTPGSNLLVYELLIYNAGPSVATQIHVDDRVDWVQPLQSPAQELEFLYDTENSDGTDDAVDWCTPPSPNPFTLNDTDDNTEPLIRCDAPSSFVLEPGAYVYRYLVFRVRNTPDPISGDVYYNEATVTVYETPRETTTVDNTEDERTTVRTITDVEVRKNGPGASVDIYTPFNMTIEVINHGPGHAPNTQVSDSLPSGMVLTGTPSPDVGTCTGAAGDVSFTCDLGDMGPSDTVNITVPVMVIDPTITSYDNTACATHDAPDTDTTNDCRSTTVLMNPPLKLGDLVWYDQNQDGIQDAGEPGLNGVQVTLYDTPDCSGSPYQPVASFDNPVFTGSGSWSDGYYEFFPLPSGDYCVKFEVPNVVLDNPILSPADQGTDDAADSDASETSPGVYQITNITLTADDMTNDVGVYEVGSIGDRVWCESPTNVNDAFEPGDGDTGLNNVTVNLYEDFDCDGAPDGPAIATTTTATGGSPSDAGFYQFTDLQVALAASSNQTCYVVEVDTSTIPGNCVLPDTPDDAERDRYDTPSLNLNTDHPDTDWADFSFRLADFGDLPSSGSGSFPTILADNGPYHLLDEDLYLGACADAENDGAPDDPDAGMVTGGDDGTVGSTIIGTSCSDDEDGIEFITPFIPGQQACILVTAHNNTSHAINLYGWADWDGDGQFQSGERLSGGDFGSGAASIPNGGVSGQQYCFDVPSSATFANGDIHFRFRLTTESLSAGAFDGPSSNGEVEDYWLPLTCFGNYLWDDQGGASNSQQDSGDVGLANIPVRLVWAGLNDALETNVTHSSAQGDDVVWNVTTDAAGRYRFCGIAPSSQNTNSYIFQVQVPPYLGLRSVTKDVGGNEQLDSDATPQNSLGTGWSADFFTIEPALTLSGAPAYVTLNGASFPAGEAGNEDNNSQTSAGYPDERTDWTQDFGFVEYKDYGDLPNSGSGAFHTTKAEGGPWHWVTPDLYLGSCVDVERDAAPDDPDAGIFAGGDDGTAGFDIIGAGCSLGDDDEDGVTLATPLIPGEEACVQVTAHNATGGTAYLYAWFDWNGNGTFDPGEQLNDGDFSGGMAAIPDGGVTDQMFCFDVPSGAAFDGGEVHMRFRLTSSNTLSSPDGGAPDGEVEDYYAPLTCIGSFVWEDFDLGGDQDAGEAGFVGQTVRLVYAGSDDTVDTGAHQTAQNDDRVYTTTTDGNGYYTFCGLAASTTGGMKYQVQIPPDRVLHATTPNAVSDDALDSDGTPAGLSTTGWVSPEFTLTEDPAQTGLVAKDGGALPTGEAGVGDSTLEGNDNNTPDARTDWTFDFGFQLYRDYGDAPDSFHTTLGNNGPYHDVTPDLYLGSCVDVEVDGQPDAHAGVGGSGGDDSSVGFGTEGTCAAPGNDEDGLLSAITPAPPGGTACFQVAAYNNTGGDARLYVWIDWDGDGQFQTDEQLTGGDFSAGYATVPDGTVPSAPLTLCFTMPSAADLVFEGGEVHSRLRLTTEDLSARGGGYELWEGPAADGEVEDYWAPLACVGNYLWQDTGTTADVQDAGDGPFANIDVRLVWAGPDGNVDTDPNDAMAQGDDVILGTTTTDAAGRYQFCGLAGNVGGGFVYQVQVPPVSGYYSVAKDAAGEEIDSDGAPANSLNAGWAADAFRLSVDYTSAPYLYKDSAPLPLNEAGNEDTYSEANDANFPDERTDWTQDFGFLPYKDFGDLPESGNGAFATTEGNNGPWHWVTPALYLGSCVDVELDGQPGARAGAGGSTGDDSHVGFDTVGTCAAPGNDEDGLLSAITPAPPGGTACFQVAAYNNTGGDARLYVWIDWDGDGQFQTDEQLTGGDFSTGYATVPDGTVPSAPLTLCFTMPSAADLVFDGGEVHSRLRLTTEDLSARGGGYELWEGPAADGEVEDYWAPLACVGNYLWQDTGTTADVQDSGDAPLPNATVRLVWAGPDGNVDTAPDDATAQGDDAILGTTTTDASGRYMFCGVAPGAAGPYVYQVQVPGMPGYYSVTKGVGGDPVLDSDATPGDTLLGGWAGDAFGLQVDYTAAPGYIRKDGNLLPTSESGNEDTYSEANDANFPDERTDWTQDLGFVKYDDYGDLPASFEAGNPAVHPLRPDLYLGACVDAETANAPDAQAGMGVSGGDDHTAGDYTVGTCATPDDDEDGVTLTTPLVPGAQACVLVNATNTTGGNAYLYGWFDWNGNGTFDAGEQLNDGDFSGGSYAFTGNLSAQELCFTVPTGATFDGGEVHYRFRLTTDNALSAPNGPAADGEVEDYWTRLACIGNLVWNDSTGSVQDQQDAGDTGVSGVEVRLVWAGPDDTIDTAPNQTAQNDDVVYTTTTDANGVYAFCGLTGGDNTYQVQLANAPSGLPEAVTTDVGDDFHDSDGAPVTAGFTAPPLTITDVTALPTGEDGNQDTGSAGYANNFPDNQVNESVDFGFRPTMTDFGDNPNGFDTEAGSNGPAHIITPDLYLGNCVDAELDGQPTANADGDDANAGYYTAGTCATAGDDEDGVTLTTPLVPGAQACVKVSAHNAILPATDAFLYAWFDWNGDGQFQASEQLNTDDFSSGYVTIPNGGVSDQTYCFTVPNTATFDGGEVHYRFRLTTATLTASDWGGGAPDGEVEDYHETLYCAGNFVWNDGGSATFAVQDGTEPGISGVTVTLLWDGDDDGAFGGAADRTYTTTTDTNGFYAFCGLIADATRDGNADAYRLDVTPPTGLTLVPADQGGDEALDSDADPATGQGPVFTLPPSPDSDTAGNDTNPNGYPDGQTHLAVDFGFAAYDFGDLPTPYHTTLADGGPQHTILPSNNPTLGTAVDAETDGQPDPAALGDDNANTDDEDGVTLPTTFVAGHTYTINCTVTNATSGTTNLSAWFDWNGDGDFADPGEQVLNNADATTACPFSVTVPLSVAAQVGVRFRIANESIPGPDGALGSGEVEDYLVAGQLTYDYGDLPDSFTTLDASGGPKHQLNAGLYLGACVDGDDDAFVDPDAGVLNDGDDAADAADTTDVEVGTCSAGDDEDGVTLVTPLLPGAQACVEVTAVNTLGTAYLYAWFDWNGNGSFDASEQVDSGDFSGGRVTLTGSVTAQQYCFTVPNTATFDGGEVHMRFRLTTDNTLSSPGGTAPDGEVEDYWTPLACVGNYVWDDTASTAINEQDASDQPLENITVELTTPGPDGILGTADDVTVTTTTDAQGRYTFCGLTPDTQGQLRISTLPAGLNQVVVPNFIAADDRDSDATQPGGLGSPAEIPIFTVPGLADLAADNWTTGEAGNEDAATQGDPTLVPGYADGRTDLSFDFGFRQVNGLATKNMVATDQTFTSGSDVAIGEIVTYEVTLTLSPGTVNNLTLTDVLDQGLAFVACDSITATGSLTASAGAWDAICSAAAVSEYPAGSTAPVDQGRQVTWTFGTVTNSGTDDATITVRYRAVVLDSADNVRDQTLDNQATWTWDAGSADASADPVTVAEPGLIITKTFDPMVAAPNETVTVILTITHAPESNADAFDVTLSDTLPAGLDFLAGSLVATAGLTPDTLNYDPITRTVTATWDEFPQGATAEIQFRVDLTVPDGVEVTNEAWVGWTSLPCDACDTDYALSSHNALAHERAYDPPASGYISRNSAVVYWVLPETGFAPGVTTPLPAMPADFAYRDLGDLWLEIPRLGVKVPIIGIPRTAEGWQLTWLGRDAAGYLEGTTFPTWEGNAVITAHVYQADGLPGPFYGLDNLHWGDRILIHFQGRVYVYEVREAFRTDRYSTKPFQAPSEGYSWVTLFTCQGYDDAQGAYRWRVVVQAVLVDVYDE